jgi:wyosine [tRNA(Phe)-imidazoG37] synthetase (radical SAM superfamily)
MIMKTNCTELKMADGPYRPQTAFGCPRYYLDNQYVYVVVCPRANGLAIGINLSPEGRCNFRCLYCEIQRPIDPPEPLLNVETVGLELERTLEAVRSRSIRQYPPFHLLGTDLLKLEQVIISGEGEPTLSAAFADAVKRIIHIRAVQHTSYFKLALYTNGSGLDREPVLEALKFFTSEDAIWVKLEAGTQDYMSRVNGGEADLERTLANIRQLARQHPVGIQSLFPMIHGKEPPPEEIDAYIQRLRELKESGVTIPMVQVFSAGPTAQDTGCAYLPLRGLSQIAHRIRSETGIDAEVF